MHSSNEPSQPEFNAEAINRLAQMLGLEIAPEDLEALSKQLRLMDALEISELHDHPPILKMDADWYD